MGKRKQVRIKKHSAEANKQANYRNGVSPFQLFFSFYTARVK
jgi:hypothetical protein